MSGPGNGRSSRSQSLPGSDRRRWLEGWYAPRTRWGLWLALGLVLLLVFAVALGWFPVGFSSPIGVRGEDVSLWQRLYHLALPALTNRSAMTSATGRR